MQRRRGPFTGNSGLYIDGPRGVLVRRGRNPVLRFLWGSKWTLSAGVAGSLLLWVPLPLPLWGRAVGLLLIGALLLLWAAWPGIRRYRRKSQAVRIVSRAAGRPVPPVR